MIPTPSKFSNKFISLIENIGFMVEEMDYILSVDIGTSELKVVLVGTNGYKDHTSVKYGLEFPKQGWVEQDPEIYSNGIIKTLKELIDSHQDIKNNIKGLVFTSQMQGLLPINKDGKPISKLITWMDGRAADITKNRMFKGIPKIEGYPASKLISFLRITGGAPGIDGKNTICRVYWIKENWPEIYADTYKFMDTKDYAVFFATGKYITSIDMAYVSWLMDTREGKMDWSDKICNMFQIDKSKFLDIKKSTDIVGEITKEFSQKTGLPPNTPVINGAGDLLCAAIGSGAINIGKLHANIGTAGWVGCHFDRKTKDIPHYTGTIAAGIPELYLLLSKQETLGGALDWAKNILFQKDYLENKKSNEIYSEIDSLVKESQPGSNGLIFTPWLSGERSPINDAYLRAQFINLQISHNRGDLLRSLYEGVGYNLKWGMEIVEKLSKSNQDYVKLIGGASKSDTWCQILSDIWQKKVIKMKNSQMASALGAACIGFVGLNIYKDFKSIKNLIEIDKEFHPNITNKEIYAKIFSQYKKLYKNNKKIFESLNS